MRRPIKKPNVVIADSKYDSVKVSRLMNYVMHSGKKTIAQKIVYDAFELIKEKTGNADPLEVFDLAMKNTSPLMEVRSRRVGGSNYQIPREVRPDRRAILSLRWIVAEARGKKGSNMALRLADEIILASKNEGNAVKKKDDTHKMAEANKAFAHFAW